MSHRCRRCNRPVAYLAGTGGRPVMVDPEPVYLLPEDTGRQIAVTVDGKIRRGRRTVKDDPKAILAYVPHYATCTCKQAFSQQNHRQQRSAAAKTAVRAGKAEQAQEPQRASAGQAVEQLRAF